MHMTCSCGLSNACRASVHVVSAPDPPCTHKKKRKESARRGSGAVDTEGLHGMLLVWLTVGEIMEMGSSKVK